MAIETLKLALEALEYIHTETTEDEDELIHAAITALRTAIAEAEEPVAWQGVHDTTDLYWRKPVQGDVRPLYTTPPAAQPTQQEPVAWRHEKFYEGASGWFYADWHSEGLNPPSAQLLYTTPPAAQHQPLTEEQIDDIWNRYCDEMGEASINDAYEIARAIEAAHGIKEKNT